MVTLKDFVSKFDDFARWGASQQADYITYYFTTEGGQDSVTASEIKAAFKTLNLKPYKRTAAYLSDNASSRKGKYVKVDKGYRLVQSTFNDIDRLIKHEPVKIAVDAQLSDLIEKVIDNSEKNFLLEASNCYRVEAYRAFVILVWIVTMHHMQKYIFDNKLNEFNVAFAKNPDKKLSSIKNYDDFSDIKEVKFIELARSANIISNDVQKIMNEKLGTRNSAAHPSGVKISGHKATEFALDLIDNILLKY
jgi:hypothetical protein